MGDKPTYLGLLNAVAVAESRAHAYFSAWADVTPDPEVRELVQDDAPNLGFELRVNEDPGFDEKMALARSDRSDLEKLEGLGLLDLCTDGEPDVFDGFFRDHSIDIQTGELLGRYIAEERDTLRRLQSCHARLKAVAAT